MSKTKKAVIGAAAICVILFLALTSLASHGYGYMGYSGYQSGPSFFYWGGPTIHHGRDVRNGSVSGSNMRGGGPGSGK
ncbi:MAG: hypothetical protein R8M45_08155 [Ghiorsea sp.]